MPCDARCPGHDQGAVTICRPWTTTTSSKRLRRTSRRTSSIEVEPEVEGGDEEKSQEGTTRTTRSSGSTRTMHWCQPGKDKGPQGATRAMDEMPALEMTSGFITRSSRGGGSGSKNHNRPTSIGISSSSSSSSRKTSCNGRSRRSNRTITPLTMPLLPTTGSPGLEDSAPRRILFLDAYDSFTNNIVSLLKDALGSHVLIHVIHMDLKTLHSDPHPTWTTEQFLHRLQDFDAVVCGPGPGSPLCDADVGAFKLLWDLPRERAVPVLGICLGFQSLVAHFGGGIRKLRRGLHGMVRPIEHVGGRGGGAVGGGGGGGGSRHRYGAPVGQGADIFRGVAPFKATLYHSLCADIGQDVVPAEKWREQRWTSTEALPDLRPLAWTVERSPELGEERILMGVRHASLPFWGVQYHPESVCTDPAASDVLRNWFAQALKWNETAGRAVRPLRAEHAYPDSLDAGTMVRRSLAAHDQLTAQRWWREMDSGLASEDTGSAYYARRIKLPDGVDAADVAEVFGLGGGDDSIILDSSSTVTGDPLARNSVIALDVHESLRAEYRVGDGCVSLRLPATASRPERRQCISVDDGPDNGPSEVWDVISEYWRRRALSKNHGDDVEPVFNGGFLGFVTYEMGLEGLSPGAVSLKRMKNAALGNATSASSARPDLCFAWVTKSIVLDHQAGVAYIQMLSVSQEAAHSWIDATVHTLQSSRAWRIPGFQADVYGAPASSLSKPVKDSDRLRFKVPDAGLYEDDVRRCQDAISEGQSYELCLTAQTTMTRPVGDDTPHHLRSPQTPSRTQTTTTTAAEAAAGEAPQTTSSLPRDNGHGTPWHIFRTLRARQPAPFGSFIRLGGATIISSSPERFLSNTAGGSCSMRPMKGTVRKSAAVSTLAQAEALLHIPKEEAENLMIVDLVRHDLYGVCGAGAVRVPELLKVEEYASVFQMITVVNGQLPAEDYHSNNGIGDSSSSYDFDYSVNYKTENESTGCSEYLEVNGDGGDHGPGMYGQDGFEEDEYDAGINGLNVLAAALPPGSMTGAPKKRSCEILGDIETVERSVYSGVVGYFDVKGQGDWSVTIRTMFRWDDEREEARGSAADVKGQPLVNGGNRQTWMTNGHGNGNENGSGNGNREEREVWRVGAGGAVTILSTPEGERDEMVTKLSGPLGIFRGVA